MKRNKLNLYLIISSSIIPTASAVSVFSHDFQNGTAGDLGGSGSLGTPASGTLSATGGFVSSTLPAYTTGNNGNANAITPPNNGTFNDVGSPSGNFITASLSAPAAITGELGAGQNTTISFSLASFGNSNASTFKLFHAVGYSATDDEVFHITWRNGSGTGTREVYAREFGEDNTTFSGGSYASMEGDLILDDVAFNINGTNTSTRPTSTVDVSITIGDSGWDASAAPTGGGSTQTSVTGLSIDSGAQDLSYIQFFSSHNSSVNNQNKGFWLDNIEVDTDLISTIPEPSHALLLTLAGVTFLRRKR